MLKAACKGPGRDSNSQKRESYECDTLPLNHLHLQRHIGVNNLSQTCYSTGSRPESNLRPLNHKSNALTTESPRHVYFEHNRLSHRHHRAPATYQVGQQRAVNMFLYVTNTTHSVHRQFALQCSFRDVTVQVMLYRWRCKCHLPTSCFHEVIDTDTPLFYRLCKKSNCNSRAKMSTTTVWKSVDNIVFKVDISTTLAILVIHSI